MKEQVNFYDFQNRFYSMGRDNQFSYAGKKALFEYLEELEADTGEEIELDIIALCCEYTEYANLKEFQSDYNEDYKTIEDIEEHTIVIKINDQSFIIQQF